MRAGDKTARVCGTGVGLAVDVGAMRLAGDGDICCDIGRIVGVVVTGILKGEAEAGTVIGRGCMGGGRDEEGGTPDMEGTEGNDKDDCGCGFNCDDGC